MVAAVSSYFAHNQPVRRERQKCVAERYRRWRRRQVVASNKQWLTGGESKMAGIALYV